MDVVDSIEYDGVKSMKDGIELILKMFVDILVKYGVEQFNLVGEFFNLDYYQVMLMVLNLDMEFNLVMVVM